MKQLDDDYDVIVDKMIPIPTDVIDEASEFVIDNASFHSFIHNKIVTMQILTNDDDKQIFAMNDGTFILEVEDFETETVSYYQSRDINELMNS